MECLLMQSLRNQLKYLRIQLDGTIANVNRMVTPEIPKKYQYIYVIYRMGGPYWKNILSRSQKRPEAEDRRTFLRPRQNIFQYGPT